MATAAAAALKPPQAEETQPKCEWVQQEGCDTLLVHLPGYLKENLKVQVTTYRSLRVLGERKINDRNSSRFQKEFSLPEDCDVNGITAKFDGGVLQVRLPKQGTEQARTTEDEKAGNKSRETVAKKQAEEPESGKVDEKSEGVAAVAKKAQGSGKSETEGKYQKMGKLRTKKVAILAVVILAVAVGLGMLQSKGSIRQIIWK